MNGLMERGIKMDKGKAGRPKGNKGKRRGGLYKRGRGATSNYYGFIRDLGGVQRKVSLWTYDRDTAKQRLDRAQDLANDGKDWKVGKSITKSIRFMDFLPQALKVIGGTVKERTKLQYEKAAKKFVSLLGDVPLKEISTRHISEYIDSRKKDGKQGQTIRNELYALSAILEVARDADYKHTERNAVRDLRKMPPINKPVHKNLSEEEIRNLLTVCDAMGLPFTSLIIRLAENCGLRAGELHSLNWDKNIDLGQRLIRIDPSKNNQGRIVPLNSHALEVLVHLKSNWYSYMNGQTISSRLPHQDEYVFCRKNGSSHFVKSDLSGDTPKGSVTHLNNLFKVVADKANIKARIHSLRHTFASNLSRVGVDLLIIKTLMGHSTEGDVTARYANVTIDMMAEAVKKIEKCTPSVQSNESRIERTMVHHK